LIKIILAHQQQTPKQNNCSCLEASNHTALNETRLGKILAPIPHSMKPDIEKTSLK